MINRKMKSMFLLIFIIFSLFILINIGSASSTPIEQSSNRNTNFDQIYPAPTSDLPIEQSYPITESPITSTQEISETVIGQREYVKGPVCFYDKYNKFRATIPEGWWGISAFDSTSQAIISNFDPRTIVLDHGAPLNLPTNNITIEITSTHRSNWLEYTYSDAISQKLDLPNVTTQISEITESTFGQYTGKYFTLTDSTGLAVMEILLEVEPGRYLAINIYPINSSALMEARQILETFGVTEGGCIEYQSIGD